MVFKGESRKASLADPVLAAVLASRLDAIVREMISTLQRAAYSSVLSLARDFSCSIVTADNQLLAAAEGLPVHIYGSQTQAEAMTRTHSDIAAGDAYLHNDPYLGNSHPADHTILVPVFVDDRHVFTATAKGHVADVGNSLPTTYMAAARDVYEEGALVFPCVRVQRDYCDIEDIIRMCQSRIRVPEQWYGDYLGMVGAARAGERRLIELVRKYGFETINSFINEWFDYSERRMAHAIQELPSGEWRGEGQHDPFPGLPDGFPLRVTIAIDGSRGLIDVDLTDNIDCVPAGVNSSAACAMSSVLQGIFSVIDPEIPHNAGSFRRVRVRLRENCVAGIPSFPHSCSLATSNPSNRLINLTQSTIAEIGEGFGLAEGGVSNNVGMATISGSDLRRGGARYINQLVLGNNGGPASPWCDGWVTFCIPCAAGLVYRDSVEIDEQKFPIWIRSVELVKDSGGPGRFRGAPAVRTVIQARNDTVSVMFPAEGYHTPARGVRGGMDGNLAKGAKFTQEDGEISLPNIYAGDLQPGEVLVGVDGGGGGYGDPLDRDPDRVKHDVLEKLVSIEQGRRAYGVIFRGKIADGSLIVDWRATAKLREGRVAERRMPTISDTPG